MQLHLLKRNTKRIRSRQIGRGGKRGKTSGRGTKGQKARAGRKIRPEMRDVIKKIPKLRGYFMKSIQDRPVNLSIEQINKKFPNGGEISIETLLSSGLIGLQSGKIPKVKILGGFAAVSNLQIKGIKISESAKKSVLEKGGKVE